MCTDSHSQFRGVDLQSNFSWQAATDLLPGFHNGWCIIIAERKVVPHFSTCTRPSLSCPQPVHMCCLPLECPSLKCEVETHTSSVREVRAINRLDVLQFGHAQSWWYPGRLGWGPHPRGVHGSQTVHVVRGVMLYTFASDSVFQASPCST